MIGPRLAIGLAGFALFGALIFGVFYYQGQAHRAEDKAQTEHQQATNNANAVQAVDHYNQTTTIIREKADAAATTIYAQPGSDTAVPDGVLTNWRSSIDGMRERRPEAGNPTP